MTPQLDPVLTEYGYTQDMAGALPEGTSPARVLRHDGASLLTITSGGPRSLPGAVACEPQPTVGDWLAVRLPREGGWDGARIEAVLPRTSLLRRASADGTGQQALAANVDVVLIVCGADRPVSAGRIQRAATQSWDAGADPVLVLTKVDSPDAADIDLARIELEVPGVPVLVTSVLEGLGLAELRARIAGVTSVLIGESGAGKSTLSNALLGRAEVATGAVREGDRKGRHTTSARQLHLLPGADRAMIIDTPGLRSLGLFADEDAVDAVFGDIQELAEACRFSDCAHVSEPGCAVLQACADGRLPTARYESWRRLQREVASAQLRADPRQLRRHHRQMSQMHKEIGKYKR